MKKFKITIIVLGIIPLTSTFAQWSEPINVGEPINSITDERRPSLNALGDKIVLNTGRGSQSGLFISTNENGLWGELEYIEPIGNPYGLRPAFSPGGDEIYYSCYGGGYGDYDIWRVVYDSIAGVWSDPINLGSNINDYGSQKAPFLSYDGQKLYFVNRSPRYEGLVVSYKDGDEWLYPEWTHYYFQDADNASLTFDESIIFYNYYIPNEYHVVFFSEKDSIGEWLEPIRFDYINDYGVGYYPRVNADGSRVFFSSDNMGGMGGSDIWYVECTTGVNDDIIDKSQTYNITVYPNPSNSHFNIFVGEYNSRIEHIKIYNILGREITNIRVSNIYAIIRWPGINDDKDIIVSGQYFIGFWGNDNRLLDARKVILLK